MDDYEVDLRDLTGMDKGLEEKYKLRDKGIPRVSFNSKKEVDPLTPLEMLSQSNKQGQVKGSNLKGKEGKKEGKSDNEKDTDATSHNPHPLEKAFRKLQQENIRQDENDNKMEMARSE